MADSFIAKDGTKVIEVESRKNEDYLRSNFSRVKNLVNYFNKNLPEDAYYYIGGGYLRDSISRLSKKDVDIICGDEQTREALNDFMQRNGSLIYESNMVKRYSTSNGTEFDISKNTDYSPHQFIYNVDFINSGIVYDSNHDIFYHSEFVDLTRNRIVKLNPSVDRDNDSRMVAFRLGKFYERGYKYHTFNINDFFNEVEPAKESIQNITVIKIPFNN